MYKELIISAIIIISIFSLDYITQKYTDQTISEAIKDLNMTKETMKGETIDSNNIINDITSKYETWKKNSDILSFYIEHDELEKVETNYVAGKSFIENAKFEDALSEVEKTIFVLEHIHDKYSINLKNLF